MLELNGKSSSVIMFSIDFPFQNTIFFLKLNFQSQKSLKFSYFQHPKSKSHNINSIKSESSRSFQQHQRHITIPILELNGRHSSVTTSSTEFSFQNLVLLEFI
jgi:hypothetical protein